MHLLAYFFIIYHRKGIDNTRLAIYALIDIINLEGVHMKKRAKNAFFSILAVLAMSAAAVSFIACDHDSDDVITIEDDKTETPAVLESVVFSGTDASGAALELTLTPGAVAPVLASVRAALGTNPGAYNVTRPPAATVLSSGTYTVTVTSATVSTLTFTNSADATFTGIVTTKTTGTGAAAVISEGITFSAGIKTNEGSVIIVSNAGLAVGGITIGDGGGTSGGGEIGRAHV
jgi:hypothetical protein